MSAQLLYPRSVSSIGTAGSRATARLVISSDVEPEVPAPWLRDGGILLHIGPPKTGTTALQSSLAEARSRLNESGVLYPGTAEQHFRQAGAALGRRLPGMPPGAAPPRGIWLRFLGQLAERPDKAVVSSEMFAEADPATAARIVAELGGDSVQVLVTLRPLEDILASTWQQGLQHGQVTSFGPWIKLQFAADEDSPFWRLNRHDLLVEAWAGIVGTENVAVLPVDRAKPDQLLRGAESLLGVPSQTLHPTISNRSLSAEEAELIRGFHERLRPERESLRYVKWIRNGALRYLVEERRPGPKEHKITTPAWAVGRARELHRPMLDRIAESGVRVVGDLSGLIPDREPPPDVEMSTDHTTNDIAAELLVGLYQAADRHYDEAVADASRLHRFTARELGAELVRRGRTRVVGSRRPI